MKMSDAQRLQRISMVGQQLLQILQEDHITPEIIQTDYKSQWLVTTPLYNIGEHVYNLSSELKAGYPDIPWTKVAGLRHRLVHSYDDTNWRMISEILYHDLPQFLQQIEAVLSSVQDQ